MLPIESKSRELLLPLLLQVPFDLLLALFQLLFDGQGVPVGCPQVLRGVRRRLDLGFQVLQHQFHALDLSLHFQVVLLSEEWRRRDAEGYGDDGGRALLVVGGAPIGLIVVVLRRLLLVVVLLVLVVVRVLALRVHAGACNALFGGLAPETEVLVCPAPLLGAPHGLDQLALSVELEELLLDVVSESVLHPITTI